MLKTNFIISSLRKNSIVAIPTDTIYGLSCLPNAIAIKKLLQLKQRSNKKGLIIIASNIKYFTKYMSADVLRQLLKAQNNITIPTTFIVPSNNHVFGVKNTIAVRLTSNKLIKKICNSLDSAIISTSANISKQKNINNILQLKANFKNLTAYLPPTQNKNPSSIVDLLNNTIIRK